MIRFLPIILFFLTATITAEISSAQQARFDQANELLDNQNVEEAVEIYHTIKDNGFISGKLYYNLGISAIYQDSLGLAKYYFIQSADFPETTEEALRALDYTDNQLNRRSAVLPKLPWERFFEWLDAVIGPGILLLIGFIVLNTGAGAIIASWFLPELKNILRYSGYGATVLSILMISSSFYLGYLDNRYDSAIMVHRQSAVHERPNTHSSLISTAYEGYSMTVDHHRSDANENWFYVRLENGMYGWIERDQVRVF